MRIEMENQSAPCPDPRRNRPCQRPHTSKQQSNMPECTPCNCDRTRIPVLVLRILVRDSAGLTSRSVLVMLFSFVSSSRLLVSRCDLSCGAKNKNEEQNNCTKTRTTHTHTHTQAISRNFTVDVPLGIPRQPCWSCCCTSCLQPECGRHAVILPVASTIQRKTINLNKNTPHPHIP